MIGISLPQMYKCRNRCFVSFPYNPLMVKQMSALPNRWYSAKLREWSFSAAALPQFLEANPSTAMLEYDVIVYTTQTEICFKFLSEHDLDELNHQLPNVTYDAEAHVFCLPLSDYDNLISYILLNKQTYFLRSLAPKFTIKRKIN